MPRRKDGPKSIGDIIGENKALVKLAKPPSRVDVRLAESAVDIRQNLPEDIAFQHSVLCQTSLPYRSTPERRWEARNGNVMLLVQAGEAFDPNRGEKGEWVQLPLPFGPGARLILMYLNSQAIRTQSPLIDVEDSMTAFLRELQGRDPNGKEIQAFKKQLSALARAKISLAGPTALTDQSIGITHGDLPIVKFIELWFPKNVNQRVLWPGKLELTQDYFNDLLEHAVPLDQRAIAALSHNARALDIYAWLAQRLHRVAHNRPSRVTWVNLHQQFGHEYKELRQFRAQFIKTLKMVQTQYPEAKFDVDVGGLLLQNSPPPIRKKLLHSGS